MNKVSPQKIMSHTMNIIKYYKLFLTSIFISSFVFTLIPSSFGQNVSQDDQIPIEMYEKIESRLEGLDDKISNNTKLISKFQDVNANNQQIEFDSINSRLDAIVKFQNNTASAVYGSGNLSNLIAVGLALVAISISTGLSVRRVSKEVGTSFKYALRWILVGIIMGMLIYLVIYIVNP